MGKPTEVLKYSLLFLLAVWLLFSVIPMSNSGSMSKLKHALDPQKGTLLAPLLKPRVPGTQGALDARKHIISHLSKARWDVKTQEFQADTPIGLIPMANIMAQRQAERSSGPKLTLAAHYDSKMKPEGFVGAIDSAFPCALLMYLATVEKKPKQDFDLIFFDGEESFELWSDKDSLYGAKALAELQEEQGTLPDTLVLLDLIGNEARAPIPSWFSETYDLYKQLNKINPRLVGGRPIHEYAGAMQDDHIPFMQRGVKILHLIPPAFPDTWHTIHDNADSLHWESMEMWAELFEKWLFHE